MGKTAAKIQIQKAQSSQKRLPVFIFQKPREDFNALNRKAEMKARTRRSPCKFSHAHQWKPVTAKNLTCKEGASGKWNRP
jgi:hypothetical protein